MGVAGTATCGFDSLVGEGHFGFSVVVVSGKHIHFKQLARKQPHNGNVVGLYSEFDDEMKKAFARN